MEGNNSAQWTLIVTKDSIVEKQKQNRRQTFVQHVHVAQV